MGTSKIKSFRVSLSKKLGLLIALALFAVGCSTLNQWGQSTSEFFTSSSGPGARKAARLKRMQSAKKQYQKKQERIQAQKPQQVSTAYLISPDGEVEEILSIDPSIKNTSVQIPNVKFSRNRALCAANPRSESIALRQSEIDLELSFLIKNLNSRQATPDSRGRYTRELSHSMLTNLYNTPDCEPYRFKLNIVKSLINGHNLESIQDSIIR